MPSAWTGLSLRSDLSWLFWPQNKSFLSNLAFYLVSQISGLFLKRKSSAEQMCCQRVSSTSAAHQLSWMFTWWTGFQTGRGFCQDLSAGRAQGFIYWSSDNLQRSSKPGLFLSGPEYFPPSLSKNIKKVEQSKEMKTCWKEKDSCKIKINK